ncbi:MAG: hypothetical protein EP329_03710 [Deltaproteobacteria bacterium]|nr:MAG: hypothetical protein EP329_03710 [Deltaproteobacteria bacterium]
MERERLLSRLRRIEETFELRDPQDRVAIIEGLGSDDEDLREVAKEAAAGAMVDELCEDLLKLLADGAAPDETRGDAAIALGPALEVCHYEGFEDLDPEEMPLTEGMFDKAKAALEAAYASESTPVLVRRRALEAAVRAPSEWQNEAIRSAWESDDSEWRLTAVFCMGQVEGFRDQLVEAMASEDIDLRCEAIFAAAEAEIEEAAAEVIKLAQDATMEKDVRLAAIHALGAIAPEGAPEALEKLAEDEDEEVAEMAQEALDMLLLDDFDDEDFDFDDDEFDDDDDDDEFDDDEDFDDDDDDAPKKKK